MASIHFIYFDLHTGYYPGLHHGLAYLIGTLKSQDHDISLSHLADEKDFDKTKRVLDNKDFDLIGLSFTTNQKKHLRTFLKTVTLSARLVVAGGVHCTLAGDEIFEQFPQIDAICIGEGEVPLKKLCRSLDNNDDHLEIDSLHFRTKSKIRRNPVTPLQEIDKLAMPDYTLFDYQKIITDNGRCFPMMLSRGCPYSCNYCCNHAIRKIYPNSKKYVRFPSVQHAINIVKNNLLLYPETQKILFADDTFTLNKNWLSDFCELYKKEINLPFLCNARVETVDEQVAHCLKKAGCFSVDFGVESGNEWMRNNILNRKHSNQKIRQAFSITQKHGIKSFSFNIVGLPFETKQMAKDTLDLNLQLQPNFGRCFYFFPYPGTMLHKLCTDYGLSLDNSEEASGYLEGPSLKEIFMSHKEIKKLFNSMQVFFYARLLFSKIKLSSLLEKLLLKIFFLFKGPILFVLDPTSKSGTIKKLRNRIRNFAMKYLR